MEVFLQVNKKYMGLGLKSVDLLIVSQIEEFKRNGNQCYVTNAQFSEMFGESESSIKRAIDKLTKLNIIKRDTVFIQGNGRANRQRLLSVNNRKKWKVQNEPTIEEWKGHNELTKEMEGSKSDNGRVKNGQWKGQNDPIKDNKNINKIKYNTNLNSNSDIFSEQKKKIIDMFKQGGITYKIMSDITGLTFDQISKIINDYKDNPKEYFYEPPKQNRLTFSDNSYIDTKLIRDIIDENGYDIKSINEDLEYYYTKSINDGIDRDEVINFFKAFNYTIENGYQEKEIEKPDYDVYRNFEDIEDLIVV